MLGLFKIGLIFMALTDAGLTVAGTAGPSVNLPPVIISTPNPFFIENVADTYDMSQNFTDDGQSTVITSLTNILPNGLSYDGNTHILNYDGIAAPSVSQHQLQVDDQVNSVVISSTFNISIVTGAAWGYGVATDGIIITGGRGLDPIYVKNLDGSGADSLLAAYDGSFGGPILFETGGVISQSSRMRNRNVGNQTIWGNTAPGGVNVHYTGTPNFALLELWKANVIWKHVRFRADGGGAYDGVQAAWNGTTKATIISSK